VIGPTLGVAAAELRRAMEAIGRRAWGRSDAEPLEYVLWHALIHGPLRLGRTELTEADLAELRRLSDACGGWVMVDRSGHVRWLPVEAWQDVYASNVDLVRTVDPPR
jgi:hypothetical protein